MTYVIFVFGFNSRTYDYSKVLKMGYSVEIQDVSNWVSRGPIYILFNVLCFFLLISRLCGSGTLLLPVLGNEFGYADYIQFDLYPVSFRKSLVVVLAWLIFIALF